MFFFLCVYDLDYILCWYLCDWWVVRQESERTDNLSLQGGLPGFRYQAQGPDGHSLAILWYLHFINTSFFLSLPGFGIFIIWKGGEIKYINKKQESTAIGSYVITYLDSWFLWEVTICSLKTADWTMTLKWQILWICVLEFTLRYRTSWGVSPKTWEASLIIDVIDDRWLYRTKGEKKCVNFGQLTQTCEPTYPLKKRAFGHKKWFLPWIYRKFSAKICRKNSDL